ncbi:hypothetical protein AB1L42_02575 [Thalassoglobus sp. JC818]|uniref:hypothetical protein n=1 Tax=Thalassoglobus sp. JC818 TaxID=3232136 RepID=UPI003459FCB1
MFLFHLVLEEISRHAPAAIDQRSYPVAPAIIVHQDREATDLHDRATEETVRQSSQAIQVMEEIDRDPHDLAEAGMETIDHQDPEAGKTAPAFYLSILITTDHARRDPVMAVTDLVHHVPAEGETMTASQIGQDVQIVPVIQIDQGDRVEESTSEMSTGATTTLSTIVRPG